ncbi:YheC/YheD family protein [Paenibacillus doosanensis]|uniref:Endospore coat-associated protein YheD n=2 Tax=Paenibacillus konkukensis TaxID=2020716 RepID=A0ABY4RPF1_9BACL|nr:YheC/YheD family protein [Paenibacillus doosanensis]MCS7461759.1 YheC/YheD family protein [Paenibacillus doosanensis]UQZ83599.1 Endospore coat-associated protein YheD [Paenibacillus konkukensis]
MGKVKSKRHILSKWKKTCALIPNARIRRFIPDTEKMTRASLKQMLSQFQMVYIKPDVGTYGHGVMRVEMEADRSQLVYRYQSGLEIKRFATYDEMYDSIKEKTKNRLYLVQMGIHLARYRKRRFDIRVMVQQSPSKKWETTAMIGKVGDPKKVVTNIHNGGTPTAVEAVLSAYLPKDKQQELIAYLKRLGTLTAKQLHSKYRGIKEIGLDVALDKNMNPWLLEVNTRPDPYVFNKLKNKSMYRKVYRYAKAYGRV